MLAPISVHPDVVCSRKNGIAEMVGKGRALTSRPIGIYSGVMFMFMAASATPTPQPRFRSSQHLCFCQVSGTAKEQPHSPQSTSSDSLRRLLSLKAQPRRCSELDGVGHVVSHSLSQAAPKQLGRLTSHVSRQPQLSPSPLPNMGIESLLDALGPQIEDVEKGRLCSFIVKVCVITA